MGMFEITILIITLLVLGATIWNILLFSKIKKKLEVNENIENKENYFELKYKIQLITTIFSIVLFTISFFGYNSINSFNQELDNKINLKVNSYKSTFDSLNSRKNSLITTVNYLDSIITQTNFKVDKLLSKNILKPDIFIVRNISVEGNPKHQVFYFKNMKTITNEKLPVFKIPPTINISAPNGSVPIVNKITNDYIEFGGLMFGGNNIPVDLWIVDYNIK